MAVRQLRLTMKKGVAIVKECTELPLKENVLLHVNEYEFYCNPTTFDRLVRIDAQEDMEKANRELTEFFLKQSKGIQIQQFCFDFDRAIDELKTNLVLGKENVGKGSYNDHWDKETNQTVIDKFKKMQGFSLDRDIRMFTSPHDNYKAMVDMDNESIEFIQFEETFSALAEKNVIAEHVNINRRPHYVIHKLIALMFYIRDLTDNPKWGE